MTDYYSILHVLPSAEIDVIKAAYKALARKYHPDTFAGDKAYAGKRMQEINDAFGVIGDPEKRKKYDEKRKAANQEDEFTSNGEENDARLEEDWKVATKYFPDAEACFAHINKLSHSLAFAFKSYLLDSKQFSACKQIRDKFRAEFLSNYFGSSLTVQEVGENLVLAGELKAAKTVNKAVKVLGNSLNVTNLIATLIHDFPHLTEKKLVNEQGLRRKRELFLNIKADQNNIFIYPSMLCNCEELMGKLGIPFEAKSGIISNYYRITYRGEARRVHNRDMCRWVVNNLGANPDLQGI